jgi:hypothetical protein
VTRKGRLRTLLQLLADAAGPVYRPPVPSERLVVCRRCGADMVAPVRWEEASDSSWWMRLRCGACGLAVDTVVADEDADAFDRELRRQTREISVALAASERRRMTEELHALSVAFELDLIDAGDFDR